VYPGTVRNIKNLRADTAPQRNYLSYQYGFFIEWQAAANGMELGFGLGTNTNDTFFEATWAYTAP
jgi:hypothetical protein